MDGLYIYLRSENNVSNYGNNSIELSNLMANGVAYDQNLIANQNNRLDYLIIKGNTDEFTLTGTANLAWDESKSFSNKSRLDLTIKAGCGNVAENVPESSTIITTLLFLGLGGVLKIFWTLNYRFCLGCIIHSLIDQ